MRGSVLAVFVVFLSGALAGCADDPPSPDAPVKDPVLHTRPGAVDATTDPTKWHLHDYWLGNEHLVVLDESRTTSVMSIGQGVNREQFRPAAGTVVPLGTANVTVTMSWSLTADSRHGPVHLYLKTQADNVSQDVGVIENGVPFTVPSTNDQNDLPHQLLSAWSFDLYLTPDPTTRVLRFFGQVSIEVIVTRGLEIPLFPPHPDHWQDATEILLFSDTASANHVDHTPAPNSACLGGCLPVHVPRDGAIVPHGADHVRVTLDVAADARGEVRLAFHAADSREWTFVEPVRTEGRTRTYEIPVTHAMADGPYSSSSLWEFQLVTVRTQENGLFAGAYAMSASAVKGI